jgi:hypothetical protein
MGKETIQITLTLGGMAASFHFQARLICPLSFRLLFIKPSSEKGRFRPLRFKP